MGKMRRIGILACIAMLCVVMAALVACGKEVLKNPTHGEEPPEEGQLASVVASSVKLTNVSTKFTVSWSAVPHAESYEITSGSASTTTSTTSVSLRTASGFVIPDTGKMTITLTAKAAGYKDSKPTTVTLTYNTEVTQLLNPEIISFNNGVIEWRKDNGVSAFILRVNNVPISDSSDNLYHGNTYDTSALKADARFDIVAISSDQKVMDSEATSFMYSYTKKALTILPVQDYTVNDGVLSWSAVEGATGYRVVDLDFNVTHVTDCYYDMSGRNVVYGVYPDIVASGILGSAEVTPVEINYLKGNGTSSSPYLIASPFDLRTIDYYEAYRTETKKAQANYYRIEKDLDYNAVSALDNDSNIFTLRKPFFGVLDGNGKKLSNIRVNYDGGYWALFDFIATGATVKNMTFVNPEIKNGLQSNSHPLNATISMIAYFNYGTVTAVTLTNASFTATAGEIGGIVARNYGTVSSCTVSGTLAEGSTANTGSASYEIAGVVLENLSGGVVDGNTVKTLTIRGTGTNIRSAAGVVSINRSGGVVKNNSFESVAITGMVASSEYGGVVAYSSSGGTVTKGTGTLGTFTCGGSPVSAENGTSATYRRGKLVGNYS